MGVIELFTATHYAQKFIEECRKSFFIEINKNVWIKKELIVKIELGEVKDLFVIEEYK